MFHVVCSQRRRRCLHSLRSPGTPPPPDAEPADCAAAVGVQEAAAPALSPPSGLCLRFQSVPGRRAAGTQRPM